MSDKSIEVFTTEDLDKFVEECVTEAKAAAGEAKSSPAGEIFTPSSNPFHFDNLESNLLLQIRHLEKSRKRFEHLRLQVDEALRNIDKRIGVNKSALEALRK